MICGSRVAIIATVLLASKMVTAGVQPCRENQLAITPTASDAGMSQVQLTFKVTNKSGLPCLLKGSPRVEFLDSHDRAVRFRRSSPHKLPRAGIPHIVGPRDSAYFFVSFETSNPYGPSECPPASAAVRITLPHDYAPVTMRLNLSACTKPCVSSFQKTPE